MTTSTSGKLAQLSDAGVSIWLDDLSRERLTSGSLARDIEQRHIVGVTTNPSIFAASIGGSQDYDTRLADLSTQEVSVGEATRTVTAADVRDACDVMRPVFDTTDGVDGRVSIEVDPRLAHHTDRTIAEARHLHWLVDRPNVMIKIPATREGLPAIRQALADGISINVTLIFSLERYREVVEAFLTGLEDAHAAGRDLSSIGSVASFFISRVDVEVDKRLDAAGPGSPLRGRAGIANARLAFEHHESTLASERWHKLADAGAKPQRPLWASTGVKDDAYPDTMYVDELVTSGVVNTMPEPTIDAFADHGATPSDTVRGSYDEARATLAALADAGVELDDVTAQLEREGVKKFTDSWEELLGVVEEALARR